VKAKSRKVNLTMFERHMVHAVAIGCGWVVTQSDSDTRKKGIYRPGSRDEVARLNQSSIDVLCEDGAVDMLDQALRSDLLSKAERSTLERVRTLTRSGARPART
jgi:hypothetical protein